LALGKAPKMKKKKYKSKCDFNKCSSEFKYSRKDEEKGSALGMKIRVPHWRKRENHRNVEKC